VEQAQAVALRKRVPQAFSWIFAPMVDIARDARWGRMVEGAGEDPYLGAAMAHAQVLGFQGAQVGSASSRAGHASNTSPGTEQPRAAGRPTIRHISRKSNCGTCTWPPFKAALDAGAGSVMSAYMDLNDVPASGNRWLLHEVLRESWKFNGFVVSDAVAVRNLVTHGYATDLQDATDKAFSAGLKHGHGQRDLPQVSARGGASRARFAAADRRGGPPILR